MKKAVIFDMDGVLINSEPMYRRRRASFFESIGMTLSEEMQDSFIGSNPKVMMADLFPNNSTKQIQILADYKEFSKNYQIDVTTIVNPHAKDILMWLRNHQIRVALASSGPLAGIKKTLATLKLTDYFELIVSGEAFKESKPNPEIYHYTVQSLGLETTDCLAVEDSAKGIEAASKAGLDVLAVKQKDYEVDQSQALAQIESLLAIKHYI